MVSVQFVIAEANLGSQNLKATFLYDNYRYNAQQIDHYKRKRLYSTLENWLALDWRANPLNHHGSVVN